MSPMAGRLVTETIDYDGGRPVTAYVPPAPPEAVVFAGDGQLIAPWGDALEEVDLPPTVIVGAHRPDDETQRLHEYSPGRDTGTFTFDPERFAAHETFFVDDLRRWACSRLAVELPADRSAVFGVSAGQSWPSPWGFAIPTSTGPSSAPRRAQGTGPRRPCRTHFHARTSWQARRNRSSSTTPRGGPMRCAARARTSS